MPETEHASLPNEQTGGDVQTHTDTDPKIPPSVVETRTPAQITELAKEDIANLSTDAQTVLAHIRGMESNFLALVDALGSSHPLMQAKTKMQEARQWVVTHLTS